MSWQYNATQISSLKNSILYLKNIRSEEEQRKNDLKRLKRHNLIWRGRTKRRFEEARSGLQICCRRTKKKKEKQSDKDEETQEDEETRNEDEETMKTKKVKLESLKLEFHVDFYPHHLPPLTNRDLKTWFLS